MKKYRDTDKIKKTLVDVKVKKKALTEETKKLLAEEGIIVTDDEEVKQKKKKKEIPNYDYYEPTIMEY